MVENAQGRVIYRLGIETLIAIILVNYDRLIRKCTWLVIFNLSLKVKDFRR